MSIKIPEYIPRRLFCWSGGGFPGLDIHCGIWRALTELGITPNANAGTSAGAAMAAFCSAGIAQADIERTLRNLTDSDIRKERFCWKMRALWINWFLDNAPIRALLNRLLPSRFAELRIPLTVVATRVYDGAPVHIASRDALTSNFPLVDSVLASMSISGVFPYVNIFGNDYADGGPRENLPLPKDWRDYDELYFLVASRPVEYVKRHGMFSRLMLNVDWSALDQIDDPISRANGTRRYLNGPKVIVIRPNIGKDAGALRFRHELIDQAYESTMRQFNPTKEAP